MDPDTLMVVPILFMVIVLPLWLILHYVSKFKATKSLSQADEETLADLWRLSEILERRIESLETILDEEAPGWRTKS